MMNMKRSDDPLKSSATFSHKEVLFPGPVRQAGDPRKGFKRCRARRRVGARLFCRRKGRSTYYTQDQAMRVLRGRLPRMPLPRRRLGVPARCGDGLVRQTWVFYRVFGTSLLCPTPTARRAVTARFSAGGSRSTSALERAQACARSTARGICKSRSIVRVSG